MIICVFQGCCQWKDEAAIAQFLHVNHRSSGGFGNFIYVNQVAMSKCVIFEGCILSLDSWYVYIKTYHALEDHTTSIRKIIITIVKQIIDSRVNCNDKTFVGRTPINIVPTWYDWYWKKNQNKILAKKEYAQFTQWLSWAKPTFSVFNWVQLSRSVHRSNNMWTKNCCCT